MNKNEKVVVFGLGYVGLPLSLSFAFRGSDVIGVDVSEDLVNDINKGITYHTEKFEDITIQEVLAKQLKKNSFKAVVDVKSIPKDYNNFIVTVGIPVNGGVQNYDYLKSCSESLGSILKKGDTVIIRSTVIPGTTEDFILPILEKTSGLKAGEDFHLAYSSERIAEGRAFEEFAFMPTVVGAINNQSLERAAKVLSIVCKTDIIKASNIKVVETSKVFENVQRDVNIAMSQEFARFTEKLGIDIYEVIKIANTHKRVNLLTPGPGVGGYCIPNAYYYLEPKAKEMGVDLDILKLSRNKNEALPELIVNILEEELKKVGKDIKGKKIGVLGIAMKDYSNDDRISPPISIINILLERGANVCAFDPIVPTSYDFKYDNADDVIKDADAILVLAKQKEIENIDANFVIDNIQKDGIVFDTRNLFTANKSDFAQKGIKYLSL
jgi:UDP-N-acetyl-D-mannosaminuronic acid dehydrogenase